MTTTLDHPTATTDTAYLRAEGYTLTARQLVLVLGAHLARFGDTLAVAVVDPLAAIDAHMRFDGDLTGWTTHRTPADVATVLARAEHIARDYFGHHFPAIPW